MDPGTAIWERQASLVSPVSAELLYSMLPDRGTLGRLRFYLGCYFDTLNFYGHRGAGQRVKLRQALGM